MNGKDCVSDTLRDGKVGADAELVPLQVMISCRKSWHLCEHVESDIHLSIGGMMELHTI